MGLKVPSNSGFQIPQASLSNPINKPSFVTANIGGNQSMNKIQ
jgi:hypothetical protein